MILDQLVDVLDLLERCSFPQTKWYGLGLKLGLRKNTLDAIERNHPGDVSRCLTECLSKWLSRADNVDSKGGATFDSLSDALKSMNENAAADKLDQESKLISLIVLVLTVCVYSIYLLFMHDTVYLADIQCIFNLSLVTLLCPCMLGNGSCSLISIAFLA